MPSPAEGIAWYLNSKGIGSTATSTSTGIWPIKVGKLFDTPHAQIALYDTGGFNPNTKWLLDFVTVQALVRGDKNDYAGAYQKSLDIKDSLLGVNPQEIGPTGNRVWWSGVTMLADIAFLGYDKNERPQFSTNFRILLERTKSTLSNRDPLNYTGV